MLISLSCPHTPYAWSLKGASGERQPVGRTRGIESAFKSLTIQPAAIEAFAPQRLTGTQAAEDAEAKAA